jgi:hypothetical protein
MRALIAFAALFAALPCPAQTSWALTDDARLTVARDFATGALELPELVLRLSESVSIRVDDAFATDCAVLCAKGVTPAQVMERIAALFDGTWERHGAAPAWSYVLDLTPAQRERRAAAERQASLNLLMPARRAVEQIASVLQKEPLSKIEREAQAWREMGRSLWSSGERGRVYKQWKSAPGRICSMASSPELRVAARALGQLDDGGWLALLREGERVYSTAPARGELALDPSAATEASEWVAQTAARYEAAKQDPTLKRLRTFDGEATGQIVFPQGAPPAGVEELVDPKHAKGLRVRALLSDKGRLIVQGEVLDEDGRVFLRGSTTVSPDAPPPSAKERAFNEDPALTGLFELPESLRGLRPVGDPFGQYVRAALARLRGPQGEGTYVSPADALYAPLVRALAEQAGLSLLAETPPEAALVAPGPHGVQIGAALNALAAASGLEWKHEDGWLLLTVMERATRKPYHVPHSVLREAATAALQGNGFSLDSLASLARRTTSRQWETLAATVALYGGGPPLFAGGSVEHWRMLRVRGALSSDEKKAVGLGQAVKLTEISDDLRRELAAWSAEAVTIRVTQVDVVVQRNCLDDGTVSYYAEVDGPMLKTLQKDPRYGMGDYVVDVERARQYLRGARLTYRLTPGDGTPLEMRLLVPRAGTEFDLRDPPADVRQLMDQGG